MKKDKREVIYYKEKDKKYVKVPLGWSDKYSIVELDDYDMLMRLGLSDKWTLGQSGFVRARSKYAPSGYVNVARVLLDCGSQERMLYKSDKTDLRRENISKIWDAREFLMRDRD